MINKFIVPFIICLIMYWLGFYKGYKVGKNELNINNNKIILCDCGFWNKDGKYIEDFEYIDCEEL